MPRYKLTYFDVPGRGRITRYLFLLAGIEFEDNRISFEAWPELKPKTPLGQMPYLDVEGQETIVQSVAIERYVAKLVSYVEQLARRPRGHACKFTLCIV